MTMNLSAQSWYLNQVIVGSGGSFSNPDENVKISSYSPSNQATTDFGDILTHSIQDIQITGKYAYIAAQDSIAKYDIDTYERLAISEAVGINRLLVSGDHILATFQFPATENFVRVYNSENLEFFSSVEDISGEAAGIIAVDQFAYVAVNGGWAGTTGSIAIIQLSEFSLVDEINLGVEGRSIMDLFFHNDMIMSVNTTPWGDSTGYISVMNRLGLHTESYLIQHTIGDYVGIKDNNLYVVMDGGIGSIDLNSFTVLDNEVVAPQTMSIAAAKLDTINDNFYVSLTDYFSVGEGKVFNISGDETGSYNAYISPDALALDYRENTDVVDINITDIRIFPIPATDIINVISEQNNVTSYIISDLMGRKVLSNSINTSSGKITIDISSIKSGNYLVTVIGDNAVSSVRFIKN